jgi:hypothetical protein
LRRNRILFYIDPTIEQLVTSIDPSAVSYYLRLAIHFEERNIFIETLRDFKELKEIGGPSIVDPDFNYSMGVACREMGFLDDAVEQFRRGLHERLGHDIPPRHGGEPILPPAPTARKGQIQGNTSRAAREAVIPASSHRPCTWVNQPDSARDRT